MRQPSAMICRSSSVRSPVETLILETAPPYEGAKPYFLIDYIDNKEFLTEFVSETCKELPLPKKKTKSKETRDNKD